MAPENAIPQSSKKETIGSTSKGFVKVIITSSNQSTRVMAKSMTKPTTSITLKQQGVTPTSQSHKTQNSSSTFPTCRVNQNACLFTLNLKSLVVFNIRKTLSHEMDVFKTYSDPIF